MDTLTKGGVAPQIEGEQGEERFAVVGLLGEMLFEQGGDALRVEEPACFDPIGGKPIFELVSQTVQQPLRERDVEAALTAPANRRMSLVLLPLSLRLEGSPAANWDRS